MMQYFNFSRLLNKYRTNFTLITESEGHYDDRGLWVKTEEKVNLEGAIISFRENKVFRSEGTLTSNDKRLFTEAPINAALQNSKVIHDGKLYDIVDVSENAEFTGVYNYTLKYVSAFKEDDE